MSHILELDFRSPFGGGNGMQSLPSLRCSTRMIDLSLIFEGETDTFLVPAFLSFKNQLCSSTCCNAKSNAINYLKQQGKILKICMSESMFLHV